MSAARIGNGAVKERPILFSAPMVLALLSGAKTQTRRLVKPKPPAGHAWAGWCASSTHLPDEGKATWAAGDGPHLIEAHRVRCPYGQPGDRLWVRESYHFTDIFDIDSPARVGERCTDAGYNKPWAPIQFDADSARRDWTHVGTPPHEGEPVPGKGRPSIHMPRWASRILLEIVSVRVERLNDISEDDCWAEGIEACDGLLDDMAIIDCAKRMGRQWEDAAPTYAALWESINGAGSWDANPWVWVVEFRRIP